jgi:hypothetical protein
MLVTLALLSPTGVINVSSVSGPLLECGVLSAPLLRAWHGLREPLDRGVDGSPRLPWAEGPLQ